MTLEVSDTGVGDEGINSAELLDYCTNGIVDMIGVGNCKSSSSVRFAICEMIEKLTIDLVCSRLDIMSTS